MSAYGDIDCPFCSERYFELDNHECDPWTMREIIERQQQEIATEKDNAEALRGLMEAKDRRIARLEQEIRRLKRYECGFTNCGYKARYRELEQEIEDLKEDLRQSKIYGLNCRLGNVDPSESEVHEALFNAQQEIEALRNPWVSVDERLPEYTAHASGRRFATVIACCGKGLVTEALYEEGKWLVFGVNTDGVTHWMPLPPEPKS